MPAIIDYRSVGPEERLLRRVPNRQDWLVWHDDFGRWIPSLAAVRFDSDGMSVFVREILESGGNAVKDVANLGGANPKPALVYEFPCKVASGLSYEVACSPDEDTPIGYAHASVRDHSGRPKTQDRAARNKLAAHMLLVHGTVTFLPPPGS